MEIKGRRSLAKMSGAQNRQYDNDIGGGSLIVRRICFQEATRKGSGKKYDFYCGRYVTAIYTYCENCSFSDCGQGGFIPIKGLRALADTVAIRECRFLPER